MALKGTATKAIVCAIDTANGGVKKTGDAANITINIMDLDTGTVSTLTDTSASEISSTNAPGYYAADVTAGEYNANRMVSVGKSTTTGITIVGFPLGTVADLIGVNNSTFTLETGLAKTTDVDGVPAAVWASGTRTLTSFGTLVADTAAAVWASGTRTLTSFGTLVADTVAAVWSATTRRLSDATNITSNGSTIDQTRIANLDATISSRAATGAAMTLTDPYDAAKTAASATLVGKVKTVTDVLNAMISAGAWLESTYANMPSTGGGIPDGSVPVAIGPIYKTGTVTPISGVEVIIYSEPTCLSAPIGRVWSNLLGYAYTYLVPGTYYLILVRSDETFAGNPYTLVIPEA